MAIYTKKGDAGETALFDVDSSQRKRISKSSFKIEAIGSIDELNSYIGVIVANSEDKKLNKLLVEVQDNLLRIGSITAGSNLRFFSSKTNKLESIIDELDGGLPVLKSFIIPGGSRVASSLQFARTLCRKAERKMVTLSEEANVKPQILTYLNRLSDCLFMLARDSNKSAGLKDKPWKPSK